MRINDLKRLIMSDLYRYEGDASLPLFIKHFRTNPGFTYTAVMRGCAYLRHNSGKLPYKMMLFFARRWLGRFRYKYGIDIPFDTSIGEGLYIGHFGCIFVNPEAVLGNNINISQGVTIGQASRGMRAGCPTLGSNIYIGPGAKIFGAIRIGNNVAIGANCVVTRDVPDNAVVVGIPGRVISHGGAEGYILNTREAAVG
jgi:serine O-acetyltransferase